MDGITSPGSSHTRPYISGNSQASQAVVDSVCIIAAVQTSRSYGIVLLVFQVSVPLHAAFTILYIAACYADIQNNACVCVRALVVQIMKSFRLAVRFMYPASGSLGFLTFFMVSSGNTV